MRTAVDEPKRILLAEDNENEVELTLKALAVFNLANDVAVTRDGAETLDYLYCRGAYQSRPAGNPVVVLLDLKMPKVDGMEVLKQIKSDERFKSIPIVMLTSSREEKDVAASYTLGANAYVAKPVAFKEFIESVRKVGVFWALVNIPPPGSITPRN